MRENLGKYYTDDAGNIWRLISFCEFPTVTFEMVGTDIQRGGAINSPLANEYKLIEDDSIGGVIQKIENQFRTFDET